MVPMRVPQIEQANCIADCKTQKKTSQRHVTARMAVKHRDASFARFRYGYWSVPRNMNEQRCHRIDSTYAVGPCVAHVSRSGSVARRQHIPSPCCTELDAHVVRPSAGQELQCEIRGDRFSALQSAVGRDLTLRIQYEPQEPGDHSLMRARKFHIQGCSTVQDGGKRRSGIVRVQLSGKTINDITTAK
jgi:hypothetical protein